MYALARCLTVDQEFSIHVTIRWAKPTFPTTDVVRVMREKRENGERKRVRTIRHLLSEGPELVGIVCLLNKQKIYWDFNII
jgi:hypothetical protein